MSTNRLERLTNLRRELEKTSTTSWANMQSWIAKATPIIRSDWSEFLLDFQALAAEPRWTQLAKSYMGENKDSFNARSRASEQASNQQKIEIVKQNLLNFIDGMTVTNPITRSDSAIDQVIFLCKRFPIFARQLANRPRKRAGFQIDDEYDLQYLMLALLRLHLNDVRPEEWTPSYAGSSSRIDFLLKSERCAIEVKKTRDGLQDAEVGAQLIIDVSRYAQHPDCDTLICFVYDPSSLLDNPRGLELDLSGRREAIEVVVIISP